MSFLTLTPTSSNVLGYHVQADNIAIVFKSDPQTAYVYPDIHAATMKAFSLVVSSKGSIGAFVARYLKPLPFSKLAVDEYERTLLPSTTHCEFGCNTSDAGTYLNPGCTTHSLGNLPPRREEKPA